MKVFLLKLGIRQRYSHSPLVFNIWNHRQSNKTRKENKNTNRKGRGQVSHPYLQTKHFYTQNTIIKTPLESL